MKKHFSKKSRYSDNYSEGYYHPSTIILGVILIYFLINFVADWQNRDENIKYKQGIVDEYDAFYGDCRDYFSENKSISEGTIEEDCKKLEEFSKKESKEIIYDIENPNGEDRPTDCEYSAYYGWNCN